MTLVSKAKLPQTSNITSTITITITINMGPLERLIGSFYLFRYIEEEEKGEGREIFLFRKSFLVSFLLPEPPRSLPRASPD